MNAQMEGSCSNIFNCVGPTVGVKPSTVWNIVHVH